MPTGARVRNRVFVATEKKDNNRHKKKKKKKRREQKKKEEKKKKNKKKKVQKGYPTSVMKNFRDASVSW